MNPRNEAMNSLSHLSEDDLDEVLIGLASPGAFPRKGGWEGSAPGFS